MELKMNVPVIERCSVSECAYNEENHCHAKAITVGDGEIPHCDTFFKPDREYHFTDSVAGVGACKVSSCIHNNQLECEAHAISVGVMDNDVECLTFTPN